MYQEIIVKTYINRGGESSHNEVRCTPLPGQGYSEDVKVQCSVQMREKVGANKLILLSPRERHFASGNICLFAPQNANYNVLTEKEANKHIKSQKLRYPQ